MKLVIVSGTGGTEISVTYLGEHETYNPGPGFNSHQSFGNLTNLLSRNLGKTQLKEGEKIHTRV